MANGAYINVQMSVSDYDYLKKLTNIRKITADQLGKTTKAYQDFSNKSGTALKGANTNLSNFSKSFSKNSSNISFQLQDIAVQAQAGTNALTIFTQQAPQLLVGFGVGGAAFGALLAFGGLLASSFGNDDSTAAKATEQLERLTKQTTKFTEEQKAAIDVLYAREILKQTLRVKELEEAQQSLNKQVDVSNRGGNRNRGLNERRKAQEDLILITEELQNEQRELARLENDRYEASIIGSQAYIQQLRDEAEANKKTQDEARKEAEKNATYTSDSLYFALSPEDIAAQNAIIAKEKAEYEAAQAAFYKRLGVLQKSAAEKAADQLIIERDQALAIAQDQYAKGLISEEQFQQEKQAIIDKYNKQNEKLNEASARAQANAYVGAANVLGGALDDLAAENEDFAKAAFLVNQAAAFTSAIVNANQAYTKALTIDPTGILPSVTLASGYAAAGVIAGQTIAGVFHNGQTDVPREASYLLDAGERVLSTRQNEDLKKFLKDEQDNKGKPVNYTINMPLDMGQAIVDDKVFARKIIQLRDTVYAATRKVEKERPTKRRR